MDKFRFRVGLGKIAIERLIPFFAALPATTVIASSE